MAKKILGVVVVLALIAVGGIFYIRHRVAENFNAFSKGKQFKALGLTLTIPPVSTGVKGFFEPYLEVEGATLSLNYGANLDDFPELAKQIVLSKGKLTSEIWKPQTIQLVIADWKHPAGQAEIKNLSFDLLPDGTLHTISADSLDVGKLDENDHMRIVHPVYEMGAWTGLMPDLFRISWSGLESGKPDGDEQVHFDDFSVALKSNKEGEKRLWEFRLDAKGGKSRVEKHSMELRPMSFNFSGRVNDMPRDRLQAFVESTIQSAKKLKDMDKLGAESMPHGEQLKPFYDLLDDVSDFVAQIDPHPESGIWEWGGLKVESDDKAHLVNISAMEGKGNFKYLENAFSMASDFLADGVDVHWVDHDFKMEKVKAFYSAEYKIPYNQVLKNYVGYYRGILAMFSQGVMPNYFQTMLAPFSQYPEQGRWELKADRIYYKSPDTEGNHRNWTLGFKFDNLGLTFFGKGDVDIKYPAKPEMNITNGNIDASFGIRLPWEKVLGLSRRWVSDPEAAIDWKKELLGEPGGIETHLITDMGPNWFGGKLDLTALADIGKSLAIAGAVETPVPDTDRLMGAFMHQFVKDGTLNFSLLLDRYSKFQAAIDRVEPGSSAGLAVIIPYVVIDNQKDNLTVKLELKDGQVLLNGKRNEWIEGQMKKLSE